MQDLQFTQIRKNMSGFIDTVVREKPQVIRRNRDIIIATSQKDMLFFLKPYELHFEYAIDEDGRYAGSIKEIEFIVGDGASLEELRLELAYQLLDYSQEYNENYPEYFNAPNTKNHAPFVIRLLLEDDIQSIAKFLKIKS